MQITPTSEQPWHNRCELCYVKHEFKPDEVFFRVLHEWAPDAPINICQICWSHCSPASKLLSMHRFQPTEAKV